MDAATASRKVEKEKRNMQKSFSHPNPSLRVKDLTHWDKVICKITSKLDCFYSVYFYLLVINTHL